METKASMSSHAGYFIDTSSVLVCYSPCVKSTLQSHGLPRHVARYNMWQETKVITLAYVRKTHLSRMLSYPGRVV